MTNPKPYIFAFLVALMAIFALLCRGCKREGHFPDPSKMVSEQRITRITTGKDTKNAELAADTLRYLAQLEAHSREIDSLMAKGKQKDKLIAQLAAKYGKKPTLGSCDTLVREQKGRIAYLKAEVAAHRKDSLNKAMMLTTYAEHLYDRNARIDSLGSIALDAEKALRKEKGKRFGVGVIGGYGAGKQGLSPFVGVGISYNLIRW